MHHNASSAAEQLAAEFTISGPSLKRCPDSMFVPAPVYADIPEAPDRPKLRELIHAQPPATIYMLITLWRLGRGDFSARCDL